MNFHDLSTDVQQELINAKADLILRYEPTRGHFAMYLMHAKFRADWIKYLDKMGYYNLSKFLTENPTRSPFFAFCPYGYDPVPCSFYVWASAVKEDPTGQLHHCDARFWARFLILNPEYEPSWLN